jgi:catechol 2,3-dioxygenase-like lactoylglutathione lyase family enzyme
MKVVALDHVQIAMPKDKEADARAFYAGLLGLKEVPKPDATAGRGGVWFECGSLQLHLGVEADFRPARKAHPALLVEGYWELVAQLRAASVVVEEDQSLPGVTRAFTSDPFGNRIEIIATHGA